MFFGTLLLFAEKRITKMNDLAKKRMVAFIIDYLILCALSSGLSMISMIVMADNLLQKLSRNFLWFMFAPLLYSILLMGIWFFLLDICRNLDLGKSLMKIELLCNGKKSTVSAAIKHSILKTVFCCIWPISFCCYIMKHEMIYDRILKISMRTER